MSSLATPSEWNWILISALDGTNFDVRPCTTDDDDDAERAGDVKGPVSGEVVDPWLSTSGDTMKEPPPLLGKVSPAAR